jgi:hypothetical protein
VHTFITPADNTEDTVILVRVIGANINFTEDGQYHSILDAALLRHLTDTLSVEQHLGVINYIGGGAAGFTAPQPQSADHNLGPISGVGGAAGHITGEA